MTPNHKTARYTSSSTYLADIFHSQSKPMQHMFSIIERVAKTEFPVLVRGESGSGKELVAKALHQLSDRKDHPFITINCAALNANILESELFGHVKGAFTGAIREHKGVFERAHDGTLFLDEIAEIPLDLQAKLLRVLEYGEFTPLGGERTIKSNVRIISATHRALRDEVKSARFRQDLLYRLRVIPIFVPPLRAHKEDIPQIVKHILKEQHHSQTPPPKLNDQAMQILCQYDWPGNIRELKNTLHYALALSQGHSIITADDLPDEIQTIDDTAEHYTTSQTIASTHTSAKNIDNINKSKPTTDIIQQALHKYPNDLASVAEYLNISRATLWRYRKKYDL